MKTSRLLTQAVIAADLVLMAALLVPGGAGAAGDTTPPTVPKNLRVTSASPTQVGLAWDASTDNVGVTAYLVLRDGIRIDRVQAPKTSYTITCACASTAIWPL